MLMYNDIKNVMIFLLMVISVCMCIYGVCVFTEGDQSQTNCIGRVLTPLVVRAFDHGAMGHRINPSW